MNKFDLILLVIGSLWAILVCFATSYMFVKDIEYEIKPISYIPFLILLFLAYRTWG